MTSFLGVPIGVRGVLFGNLYLTDKRSEEVFTDIDQELVVGLAAAAGAAIDNAHLLRDARRRDAEIATLDEERRTIVEIHDRVINELHTTGLALHRAGQDEISRDTQQHITHATVAIDHAINHIRRAARAASRRARRSR
jgi:GAF domain-containing protein